MAVTADRSAPYAPAGVILDLVRRYREKGLPVPITAETLTRAGVTDSLNSRTLQALEVLDLMDAEGRPTPVFEGIRLAPESEYGARLGDWLRSAYADVLNFVDPATASDIEVRDAFRSYKPHGQQDRMVSLFLGLCEAAGLAPERKRRSQTPRTPSNNGAKAPRPPRAEAHPSAAAPQPQPNAVHGTAHRHSVSGLHPALSGLLSGLPQSGETWTKSERDRFVHAFETVLDFCFPVSGEQ